MKRPLFTRRQLPCVAIIVGIILLLGVMLSFRFVCARLAVVLLGWGFWSFWCCK